MEFPKQMTSIAEEVSHLALEGKWMDVCDMYRVLNYFEDIKLKS